MRITLHGIPKCRELQGNKRLMCLKAFCRENDSRGESYITFTAKMREIIIQTYRSKFLFKIKSPVASVILHRSNKVIRQLNFFLLQLQCGPGPAPSSFMLLALEASPPSTFHSPPPSLRF